MFFPLLPTKTKGTAARDEPFAQTVSLPGFYRELWQAPIQKPESEISICAFLH